MKRVLLSIVLLMGLGITQINAQRVSFGVKGEANMSNFILTDLDDMESKMGVGAGIGGFVKIDFGEYFALQPELLIIMQNSKFEERGIGVDFQYWGMEIPLYAMGQLHLENNDRAYIGIGPFGRLGFSAKNTTNDVSLYEKDNNDEAFMQRGDVGAGVLLGYEFAFGMQINASYKMGLLNTLDALKDDAFMRNQSISLGIAYSF